MKKIIKKPPMLKGEVEYWNEKKGYGFINVENVEKNIYFHINSYAYKNRRPKKGDKVVLFLTQSEGENSSAARVVARENQNMLYSSDYCDITNKSYCLEAGFYLCASIIYFSLLFFFSPLIASVSLGLSLIAFWGIYYDKIASITRQYRIPNATLYVAAILGAWSGILIARTIYKHKIKVNRFIVFFSASITINFFLVFVFIKYLFPMLND